MKILLLLLFSIINCKAQQFGFIKEKDSGETLIGVTIKNLKSGFASISNNYGYFSIKAQISDVIRFSMVGFKDTTIVTNEILNNKPQLIYLQRVDFYLKELVVTNKEENYSSGFESGKIHLSSNQIKQIPMLLGEKDPIKALQFFPGIQEISEGSSSISVRGGALGQNLMILDEATVYNANHLFGVFSTFNADPIKQMDAYKSGFPSQYGGRLSSIIDVRMREGNSEKIKISGGIGLISSRLLIEGPIKKSKSSFLISGRRTYLDQILIPFQSELEKTGYNFFDLNAKLNFVINPTNSIFISTYIGKDIFYQRNKIPRRNSFLLNNTNLNWGNLTSTARWNKIYNSKFFQNLSFIYTKYNMNFGENTSQDYLSPPRFENINMVSTIEDFSIKLDFDYFLNNNKQIKWGTVLTHHNISPRELFYETSTATESFKSYAKITSSLESAAYFSIIGKKNHFFYNLGLRVGYFQLIKIYTPEPRILIGYNFNTSQSISGSYTRMNQFLHLISNTGNGLPTDVWIPSSKNLTKASSDMISLSYNSDVTKKYNIVIESYYKWIFGNTAYKSGTNFLGIGQGINLEPFKYENSLLQGKSWNYGYEFMVQKKLGKLTGFAGYTLAWSIAQFDDLNEGKPFFNRQDRRHVIEATAFYHLKKRVKISSNFIFASGNALSFPNGIFFRENRFNNYLEIFSSPNNFRAESYHRLDLAILLETKKAKGSWEFSVYNLYNRKNPYNYDLNNNNNNQNRTQNVGITRQWLIPVLPSITYNFKIK